MQNVAVKYHAMFIDTLSVDGIDFLELSAQVDYVEMAMLNIKNELPSILWESGTPLLCTTPCSIRMIALDLIG